MLSSGKAVAGKVKAAIKRKTGPARPWQHVANQMLGGR